MGQLVMLDEDELRELQFMKIMYSRYKEQQNFLSKMRQELYPERDVWIDTGTTFDVNEVFLETLLKDLRKDKKWNRKILKSRL